MTIFQRRQPQALLKKVRELLWPSMGWIRTIRYHRHRMFRTGDSAYRITAGLAVGMALSFSPFLGTHLVQALFFTWLLRASFVASFIGSSMCNPLTLPFIFTLIYRTGIWLCGLFGLSDFTAMPEEGALTGFMDHPMTFFHYLVGHPLSLLLPLTVGGYLWAFLCWPVAYLVLYYPVRAARRAYLRQRALMRWRRKKERVRDSRHWKRPD